MKTHKQRARESEQAAKARRIEQNRPKDAHYIPHGEERMDVRCDSCGKLFYVHAARLRCDGELDLPCPYCKRDMLVQHVEYAVAMVID